MNKFGTHWTDSRPFKLLLVLFSLSLNILWHLPLDGYVSGFMILWREGGGDAVLAIFLQLILLYSLGGSLYFFIKNV